MCGRFTVTVPADTLGEIFGAEGAPNLPPRFNVAPTQDVVIVRRKKGEDKRVLETARWGLAGTAKMINARQETIFEKAPFVSAVKKRRCLVPADGFFEWKKLAGGKIKQPLRIRLQDGKIFAMAGVHEKWKNPAGEWVETCSVLTTKPNSLVAGVHDRMPVILPEDAWELWLDPSIQDREPLEHLFLPFPPEQMIAEPVSRRANDVNNDDASCIEVVEMPLVEEAASGEEKSAAKKSAKAKQLGFNFD
jgi:putative SOS response-associated peptidase YedK